MLKRKLCSILLNIRILLAVWLATASSLPIYAGPLKPDLELPTVPERRGGYPLVLIDRSHDWMFAHDDLADRMLAPAGFDAIKCDASLNALGPLNKFHIIVVQQFNWPTTVSMQEKRLLVDYMRQGGSLIVLTKPKLPMANFIKAFGLEVRMGGKKPLYAEETLQKYGGQAQVPTRAVPCHIRLENPDRTLTLIRDERNQPVVAAVPVGKGKLVVWADTGWYWDFAGQRDRENQNRVASAPTTISLFRWLVDDKAGPKRGRVRSLLSENVIRNPPLIIRFPDPCAEAAMQRTSELPRIMKVVEECNGYGPPTEPHFTVNWLSAGGGGWAGGRMMGVCVYGQDPAYPIKVMGHELTHCATGAWPWAFNEAWAVIVGTRSAEACGYGPSAKRELANIMKQLDKEDPDRNRIDVTQCMKNRGQHVFQRKATWLLLEMEKRYGQDFMVRFLKRRYTQYERKHLNLIETYRLFFDASNDPHFYKWLASTGTTIPPVVGLDHDKDHAVATAQPEPKARIGEPEQRGGEWEAMDLGLYIHYCLQTFAGGNHPKEELIEASRFRTRNVDVAQWVKTAKGLGANYAVLVAKHEYGFCLWDSEDYDYDIGGSPAKRLDLIGDFIDACTKEGIKAGIHYSIPDIYNEGARKFRGPVPRGYFKTIKNHTEELHKKYPGISIHRFDLGGRLSGAQRKELHELIEKLNPDCVVDSAPWPKRVGGRFLFRPSPGLTEGSFEPKLLCGTVLKEWIWKHGHTLVPADAVFQKYQTAKASGASFLVNVGPDPSGRIPSDQLAVLAELKEMIAPGGTARGPAETSTGSSGDVAGQLTKLKSLYDQGLITKEAYEAKQKDLLDKL